MLCINTVVVILYSFRVEPFQGYIDRVKRIYSYLSKFKHETIIIHVEEPDMSGLRDQVFYWEESIYGRIIEILPDELPELLENNLIATSYYNSNFYYNISTRKYFSGNLYMLNKTPIDWFSKKQPAVDSDTYRSGYSLSRTYFE